jgi:hypothetical protein
MVASCPGCSTLPLVLLQLSSLPSMPPTPATPCCYICGEQIGMNAANMLNQVNMDVIAQDFYFGGPGDIVTGLTVTPLGERFYGEPNDVPDNTYNRLVWLCTTSVRGWAIHLSWA